MSIEFKFLIPTHKGSIVRDPISKDILPEEGVNKPWTGPMGRYWKRRVKDGSVYIGNQKTKGTFKKKK